MIPFSLAWNPAITGQQLETLKDRFLGPHAHFTKFYYIMETNKYDIRIIIASFVLILVSPFFTFYLMPCPIKMWVIMNLHKFIFFIILRKLMDVFLFDSPLFLFFADKNVHCFLQILNSPTLKTLQRIILHEQVNFASGLIFNA